MNQAELRALNQPISNDARVLYLLGLYPLANASTGITEPLDYKALLALLNGKEPRFTRGRQINALIKELLGAGLVSLNDDDDIQHSLNGKTLLLTLRPGSNMQGSSLPQKYVMHRHWQPQQEQYQDIAKLIGIIEPDFSEEQVGEFVAYWQGRTDVKHTDYQWTQKFAQQIKRQRTAIDTTPTKQVGTQTQTNPVSSLEADDNAKRLVAKYKQSKKS